MKTRLLEKREMLESMIKGLEAKGCKLVMRDKDSTDCCYATVWHADKDLLIHITTNSWYFDNLNISICYKGSRKFGSGAEVYSNVDVLPEKVIETCESTLNYYLRKGVKRETVVDYIERCRHYCVVYDL